MRIASSIDRGMENFWKPETSPAMILIRQSTQNQRCRRPSLVLRLAPSSRFFLQVQWPHWRVGFWAMCVFQLERMVILVRQVGWSIPV